MVLKIGFILFMQNILNLLKIKLNNIKCDLVTYEIHLYLLK